VVVRHNDQRVVAVGVALSLVILVVAWLVLGAWRGDLVEIERAAHRTGVYQVDINRAGWVELAQLPGVGETLAKRIVRFRGEHGPFVINGKLLSVHGIGSRTLAGILPYLRPLPARDARPAGQRR